jgi:hypothetical protein
VEMQVWARGIACIAQFGENLRALDTLSRLHQKGIFLQMRVKCEKSVAEIEHNVIAVDVMDVNGPRVRQPPSNLVSSVPSVSVTVPSATAITSAP